MKRKTILFLSILLVGIPLVNNANSQDCGSYAELIKHFLPGPVGNERRFWQICLEWNLIIGC